MTMFRNLMKSKIILPAEYQQVEYIESSGSQYIDTDISGNDTAEYAIKFDTLDSTAHGYEQYFAGVSSTNNSIGKIFFADNLVYYQSQNILTSLGAFNSGILDVKVKIDEGIVSNGSVLKTYPGLPWGSYSFYIFSAHQESGRGASMRLYSLTMWSNGEKVREYIPCYQKSNNEIGLYDLVSETFYTNEGSGTFTKGADV